MGKEVTNARIAQRFILSFILMSAALFGSAGTVLWPEAWLYIVVHLGFSFFMTSWLKTHDPDLLKSRMQFINPSARDWDKRFLWIFFLLFIPFLVVIGLDAIRFGWTSVWMPFKIAAVPVLVWGLWMIYRVMKVNSFASPFVEVQEDRGHRVVQTGPYAYVRHPMYLSTIVMLFALPVWLGSICALLLAAMMSAVLVVRIFSEEEVLCAELEGYTEYTGRVHYRLIPKIW
ncbi:MAG: isoprenylcysteine carboxylmethyltransferase family protein [Mariprofundaceae bacterium]